MQRRDYILRMIEQFGAALVRIRQMILGGASAEAVHAEMQTTARNAGIDLDMARLASADTIIDLMSTGSELNPSRCWLTAELLLVDALDADAAGDDEGARLSYTKSLRLFSLIEPGGAFLVGWPEAGERVEEVRARLASLDTNAGTAPE